MESRPASVKHNFLKHLYDNYIDKHRTGSATMINLDGQWEHNFTDDKEKK